MRSGARLAVAAAILAAAISQVFLVPAQGATSSNPAPITVPVLGATVPAPWPGSPYPSTITLAGQTGVVNDVNLTLHGLDCSSRTPDFAFPEDVDLMLVGPGGLGVVVLSDIGGANQNNPLQFTDLTVTLDDEAAAPLPADTQLSGGTYRPLDDDDDPGEQVGTDTFPAPAPAPSASTALSAFDNADPNGMWSLYLVDDYSGPNNCSVLRGWTIEITTGDPTTTTTGPTTTSTMPTTTTAPTTTTTIPPPAGGGEGRWDTTAALSVPRYDHTTTLLAGGKVLVAAGRAVHPVGAPEIIATAEVFNPHDETWSGTGPLGEARWRHTATVLQDGRVLVAGGFGGPYAPGANAQPVLATAELYDPQTGTWSPTAPMATRRALHAAALLPDGRVMVAGGRTCASPPPAACNFTFVTPTIELFDPSTGTWSAGGVLNAPRHTTAAAVLADGKVLVPGGFVGAGSPSGTADTYDPATGTSTLTGPLNVARSRQGAAVLGTGRVLVAVGFQGGRSSEVYDPATRAWTRTGDMLLAAGTRFNFTFAELPDGKALVAGGWTNPASLADRRTAEVFDPATGQWSSAGRMHGEHGSSSSLGNSDRAVVLSSNPWRFEARPEACAPNCGKVLTSPTLPTNPFCSATSPRVAVAATPPRAPTNQMPMRGGDMVNRWINATMRRTCCPL